MPLAPCPRLLSPTVFTGQRFLPRVFLQKRGSLHPLSFHCCCQTPSTANVFSWSHQETGGPPPAHASCLRGSSTCTPGPRFPASCSKPQETALHPHDGDGGTIFCFSPNFLFSANDTFFKILPPVNVCLKTRAVKSLRARRGHAPWKLLLQPEDCFSFPRVLAENLQADGAQAFPAE